MKIGPMRLQRMIALSSELSRRAAEKAIAAGQVSVNGSVVSTPGMIVDPRKDAVCLTGKRIFLSERRHYIAFFKPKNVICTKSDPQGRETVWDYLEEWKDKLNTVGRLDFDSEGLILLTDDGDFLNRLTHPRHEIWKTYRVRVKGEPDITARHRIEAGIELEDGKTLPGKMRRIDHGDENALLEISIREGKNRQVRRMCEALGLCVIKLRRVSIGSVKLGRLKPGEWRHLRADEIRELLC